MNHSTRNSSNGRFTKPLIIEQDRPSRQIGVTEVVLTLIVLGAIAVLVDMYVVKIF